jgi:hypothetical protein
MPFGSWPHLVIRGSLEVLPRVPVHRRRGKTASLLRGSLSIYLIEVPVLSASPNVAKSPDHCAKPSLPPFTALHDTPATGGPAAPLLS